MRIQKINIQDIGFKTCQYENSLYLSIQRIGLSFPIKVAKEGSHYICIDGHKRLTILQQLLQSKQMLDQQVHCIVMNDGSSRSNDCWRTKNWH